MYRNFIRGQRYDSNKNSNFEWENEFYRYKLNENARLSVKVRLPVIFWMVVRFFMNQIAIAQKVMSSVLWDCTHICPFYVWWNVRSIMSPNWILSFTVCVWIVFYFVPNSETQLYLFIFFDGWKNEDKIRDEIVSRNLLLCFCYQLKAFALPSISQKVERIRF